MTRIYKLIIPFFIGCLFLTSCEEDIIPSFTFSPENPKAGELVTFTNTTTKGEDWNWSFGDDSKTTYKSPTKTYTKAGVYDVTLQVDSNSNYVCTKQITVYDTIPTIMLNEDINCFELNKVSVLLYNPYDEDVTYQWTFSENAQGNSIVNKVSTSPEVEFRYNKHSVNETIKLEVSIGDSTYTVSKTVYVNNVKSHSLIMASANSKLLRQRIFENGLEEYTQIDYTTPQSLSHIQVSASLAYMFAKGTDSELPHISTVSLNNLTEKNIISSTQQGANYEFNNGLIQGNNIYWTDQSNYIYKTPISSQNIIFEWKGSADAQTQVPYYFVAVNHLPYFGTSLAEGQASGGIAIYDNTYFWAKKGSGQGIYRFIASDIAKTAGANVLGAILTEHKIQAFGIDNMNAKIYFIDETGVLYVSNIDGRNATQIASNCTGGLAIDNKANQLFWTTTDNVMYTRLIATDNNKPSGEAQIFAEGVNATHLSIDNTTR